MHNYEERAGYQRPPRMQTADDWDMYASMAGVNEVADQLWTVLQNEIRLHMNFIASDVNYTMFNAVNDIYERLETVMRDYSEFGASDTEPRAFLRDYLEAKLGVRPEW